MSCLDSPYGFKMPHLSFAITLCETIVIEIIVVLLWKLRTGRALLSVVLVNVITNPLLNYGLWFLSLKGLKVTYATILIAEVVIVLVEWLLLMMLLKQPRLKLLLISVSMNVGSFAVGWAISAMRF